MKFYSDMSPLLLRAVRAAEGDVGVHVGVVGDRHVGPECRRPRWGRRESIGIKKIMAFEFVTVGLVRVREIRSASKPHRTTS